MELFDSFLYENQQYQVVYREVDSFAGLTGVNQCYGVCFYHDKIVLGYHSGKNTWSLLGGKPEPGETFEQTLAREVQEESNMRILSQRPLGYQSVTKPDGTVSAQLRFVCEVEPIGPFVGDPAPNGVSKIEFFDPSEVPSLLGWGKIGEQVIERAVKIHSAN